MPPRPTSGAERPAHRHQGDALVRVREAGTYTLTLTVTDDVGQQTSTTITVMSTLRAREVSVNLTVRFQAWSARLTAQAKRVSARIRPLIPKPQLAGISGFCSTTMPAGDEAADRYAREFSLARARAVLAYLLGGAAPLADLSCVRGRRGRCPWGCARRSYAVRRSRAARAPQRATWCPSGVLAGSSAGAWCCCRRTR